MSGPVAPENNPPIHPEYYQPSRFVIEEIILGQTTVVVTEEDNNYVVGQLIRFIIPPTYGTRELNEQEGYVISLLDTDIFEVNIDSTQMNEFEPFPSYGPTPPQVVAVGDVNTGYISTTGRTVPATNIPGSFINISPQ